MKELVWQGGGWWEKKWGHFTKEFKEISTHGERKWKQVARKKKAR